MTSRCFSKRSMKTPLVFSGASMVSCTTDQETPNRHWCKESRFLSSEAEGIIGETQAHPQANIFAKKEAFGESKRNT